MKDLDIVPECYIDTNLVETLLNMAGEPTDGVNHQKGCNTVVKTITEKMKGAFALGVIDADKLQPSYIKECEEIAASQHISLLKHRTNNHYFLRIQPAMDKLILDCAEEAGIDLTNYGLTSDLKAFTNITKKVNSKNDPRFKKMFKRLRATREMTILSQVLCYLKSHKHTAHPDLLHDFFA